VCKNDNDGLADPGKHRGRWRNRGLSQDKIGSTKRPDHEPDHRPEVRWWNSRI